jgi:CheY-like chemotaxis protein
VVQAARVVVRPAADAKEIHLRTLIDAEAGVVVGDPERLKQVIWNLAYNAVKFTPKGGRVQIVLERVEPHVAIRVSDTGQGISPEFLPHVFQRFEQADVTATRTHGGLGLGLAIVRQLVDLHGGSVEAESPGEGQGAVFTVKLPLATPRRAGTTGTRPSTPGSATTRDDLPSLDGLRVLVVDDEPDSNDAVGTLLASCGAEVQVAGSASEALETLGAWNPHVLVTDIAMPDEDGYDLLAKVRNLPGAAAQTFAVALTAHASRDDHIRVLSAGFQAHVPKPVDPIEVTTVVANLGHTARRVRDGVVSGEIAAGSGIAET